MPALALNVHLIDGVAAGEPGREQDRMVLLGAQSVLHRGPPRVKDLLGLGLESQEGHRLRRQVLGGDRGRVERVQPLKDRDDARPGRPGRSTFRHGAAPSGHTAS